MKDFLWMLYLAFNIYNSIWIIGVLLHLDKQDNEQSIITTRIIIACLMWSIWYIYFLH